MPTPSARHTRSLSFRARLLVLLLVVSIVQVTIAAVTFNNLQTGPTKQRLDQQLYTGRQVVAPLIDGARDDARSVLNDMLADEAVQASIRAQDWSAVGSALESTYAPTTSAADSGTAGDAASDGDFAATDDTAATTAETDGQLATNEEDDATSAITNAAPFITDATGEVVAGTEPEAPYIDAVTALVRDGPDLLGTIHVPVELGADFLAGLSEYSVNAKQKQFVFASDGEQVMTVDGSVEGDVSKIRSQDSPYIVQLDGADQRSLVTQIGNDELYVGIAMKQSAYDAEVQAGRGQLIMFLLVMIGLMAALSVLITKSVSNALRVFAGITRDLATGRLDRRIPVSGRDEIALLSTSFNNMAESLQRQMRTIEDSRARMHRQAEAFGEALKNATDVGALSRSVCDIAVESTSAAYARFWTVDDEGTFSMAGCRGLREGDRNPCGLELASVRQNRWLASDGQPQWLVVPARSTEGAIVGLLTLVTIDGQFAGDDIASAERVAIQAAFALDNARLHAELKEQATLDGLTKLPNHRTMQEYLNTQLASARMSKMPLGVALLDIDNFKSINDTHGHQIGDDALKAVAAVLRQEVSKPGFVARYGGEEFVIVMPGLPAAAAWNVADIVREALTHIEVPLPGGDILRLTASFGVASTESYPEATKDELLNFADQALYVAKRSGKNCVELAGDIGGAVIADDFVELPVVELDLPDYPSAPDLAA